MTKHSIDKLFKQRLGNLDGPVPDHLWSNIDQRINGGAGDNRRGGLWISWLSVLLVLLLASAGIYWALDSAERSRVSASTDMTNTEQVWNQANPQGQGNQTGASENSGSTEEVKVGAYASDLSASSDSEAGSSFTRKGLESGQVSRSSVEESTTKSISNVSTADNALTAGSNSGLSSKASITNTSTTGSLTNATGNSPTAQNSAANTSSVDATQLMQEGLTNDIQGVESREALDIDECPTIHKVDRIESTNKNQQRNIREAVADLNGFGKKRFIGQWSIAGIYGAGLNFRNLEARSPDGEALLNQRNKTEKFHNAYSAGIELRLKVRQWSVHTGLHYSQINEQNTYTLQDVVGDIDNPGITGDYIRTAYNRNRMLEIPLLVGYQWSRGPWAVEAQVGGNIGLATWSEGEVFDETTLMYTRYTTDNEYSPYTTKGIHSVQGGAMISYKAGYFHEYFVRPYYRSYLGDFTRETYALRQRNTGLGVQAGVRLSL